VTSPPPPPDAQAQLDQFLVHAAELYALEKLASKAVVGPLRAQIAQVHRRAAALWVTLFGSLDAHADPIGMSHLVTQVKRDLREVDPAVADRLADFAEQALTMGVEHAADEAGVRVAVGSQTDDFPYTPSPDNHPPSPRRPQIASPESSAERRTEPRRPQRTTRIDWPTEDQLAAAPRRPGRAIRRDWPTVDVDPMLDATTRDVIAAVDDDVRKHLATAEKALDKAEGDTFATVTDALAPAQKAIQVAEQATTYTVNAASTAGIVSVAAHLPDEEVQLVWVAERDACVHCLAYAGEVIHMHESFPVDLTYGKKPLVPWPEPQWLSGPPLHPNCRCRLSVWLGHAEGAPGPTLPEVLKREAQRSILKGWRMETESEGVRLAAADRLLARGVNAPKSVKNYARTAIKRGRFPSRSVPSGNA
jgi:hypothetical protein